AAAGSAAVAGSAASSVTASGLPKYDPLVKEHQVRLQRRTRQHDAALQYSEALPALQSELEQGEGDALRQRLWDERYHWWIEHRERTGAFPDGLSQFYVDRYPAGPEA